MGRAGYQGQPRELHGNTSDRSSLIGYPAPWMHTEKLGILTGKRLAMATWATIASAIEGVAKELELSEPLVDERTQVPGVKGLLDVQVGYLFEELPRSLREGSPGQEDDARR